MSLLRSLKIPDFKPLRIFANPWAQTVVPVYLPQGPDRVVKNQLRLQHIVNLSDGDQVVLIEDRLQSWQGSGRIFLLVHGLTGSHESNYMVRMARKLVDAGHCVYRMNQRGCGPGFGLAKKIYHSGRSEDTRDVVKYLKLKHPQSPVTQIGFSLGANISLKMAGEDGCEPTGNLDSVIAVSPPAHLEESSLHIRGQGRVFDRFFVNTLIRDMSKRHLHFQEPLPDFPKKLTLTEFDDFYTAPFGGFSSARDYYEKSSSLPLIQNIQVKTLILAAVDDPIVDTKSLLKVSKKPNLDLIITDRGGHIGFLGWSGRDYRWMDELILRWSERELK